MKHGEREGTLCKGANVRQSATHFLYLACFILVVSGCGSIWRVTSFEVENRDRVVPATSTSGAQYLTDRAALDANARVLLETQGRPDYVTIRATGFGSNVPRFIYVADDRVIALEGPPNASQTVIEGPVPENLFALLTPEDRKRLGDARGSGGQPYAVTAQPVATVTVNPPTPLPTATVSSPSLAVVDYGPPPPADWQQRIKEFHAHSLKDPYSAVYEFKNPPRKGWIKLLNVDLPTEYGWVVSYSLNAKNGFGGYVGAKDQLVVFNRGKMGIPITTEWIVLKMADVGFASQEGR